MMAMSVTRFTATIPYSSTICADSMRTSRCGFDASPPLALTGVAAILSTTSSPSRTRPKMVYDGGSPASWPCTMKNWLPLVFGPGVGHGHDALGVAALHRLVGEAVARTAAPGPGGIAGLDHKALHDAVEGDAVVVALARQEHEVVHRLGASAGNSSIVIAPSVVFSVAVYVVAGSIAIAGGLCHCFPLISSTAEQRWDAHGQRGERSRAKKRRYLHAQYPFP